MTASLAFEEAALRARVAEVRAPPPPQTQTALPPVEVELCARFHGALTCGSAADCAPSTSTVIATAVEQRSDEYGGCDSPTHLRYERKSPTRSVSAASTPPPLVSYFDELPWHVMYAIFDNLELRDRIRASMVCQRWRSLLTDGRFPLEDVVVMNVFEREVWENSLSASAGSKFQCAQLERRSQFAHALAHCTVATSVKIWYFTVEFARAVLDVLRQCNVKMRCLDVYPYSQHIGIEHFHACLPDVRGLTMRPHGHDYFFKGLDLEQFPEFGRLETLNLDCINLCDETQLPFTLTTLEWQSRNDDEFRRFLPKLAPLTRLQFLLLGHANFYDSDFDDFLKLISRMPALQYLIFKFVKIDNISYSIQSTGWSPLHQLQFLKFDLCYGNLTQTFNAFLQLTSSNLRIISLNLLSDECTETAGAFQAGLFDVVARRLYDRQITLHLGFLQRDNDGVASSARVRRQIAVTTGAECSCYGVGGDCEACGLAASMARPPTVSRHFEAVLGKFEASFVSDASLLNRIFGGGHRFTALTELKFIQCEALTDELLGSIATGCSHLRKLSILSCTKCEETGVRHFVEHFAQRESVTLKIVWKRDRHKFMRPSNFFLNLINEYKHLLAGLKYRFMCKTFGEGNNGEAIIIWRERKRLFIQDFDEFDRNRILGFVLPTPSEANIDSEAATEIAES